MGVDTVLLVRSDEGWFWKFQDKDGNVLGEGTKIYADFDQALADASRVTGLQIEMNHERTRAEALWVGRFERVGLSIRDDRTNVTEPEGEPYSMPPAEDTEPVSAPAVPEP